MGEVQSHTRPSYFFQNSYLRKQSSNCKKSSLKNVNVLVLVCCGAGAVGSSGFGRHSGRGTSVIRLCPVGRKIFSSWKEELFLVEGKTFPVVRPKSSQFSKIWMVYGRTTGKFFPVVGKFFSCRMEKLFLSDGRTWNVGRKNLECQKDLTRQFTL